jgi:hypothetical protein
MVIIATASLKVKNDTARNEPNQGRTPAPPRPPAQGGMCATRPEPSPHISPISSTHLC